MYTIHHPQPVQLPSNAYTSRESFYGKAPRANDKSTLSFFENHIQSAPLHNGHSAQQRAMSPVHYSAHSELNIVGVEDIYRDSPIFREYLSDHETSLAKFGVFTDAISEVYEAGKLFEKSVQILALAISDLLGDKYNEDEEKCETLLSKLAHLVENFDQHQHSASEKLSDHLHEMKNRKKKSDDLIEKLAPAMTACREECEKSLEHSSLMSDGSDMNSIKGYQEEALALFSSKEKLCKVSLEYSKELTQAVRMQKKTQISDISTVINLVHSFQDGTATFLNEVSQNIAEMRPMPVKPNSSDSLGPQNYTGIESDVPIALLAQLQNNLLEEFEVQDHRLHKYLSSYYEELRALCFEKMYGRSHNNHQYPGNDKHGRQMHPYIDVLNGTTMSTSPPPSTPRSPLPNQIFSQPEPPMLDPSVINGGTNMRGYMYKKSIKNDISIWRRRYFYLMASEARLMQYEDDQDDTAVADIRFCTVRVIPLVEDKENVISIISADQKEILLKPETENELYEWMQALTAWQDIRPQDSKSTSPMLSNSRNKIQPMSLTRKPSYSTISSAPFSGTNFYSARSEASGIVSLKMRYMNNKQGAKQLFTALGRQKPVEFNQFSLSAISLDPSETLTSTSACRTSYCPGSGVDGEILKHGKVHLRVENKKDKNFSIKNSYWRKLHCSFKSNGKLELFDGHEHRQVDTVTIPNLNRNQIYPVEDSVFSTFGCFAVRTSPIRAIYLSVGTRQELESWLTLLKIFAQPNVSGYRGGNTPDIDSFLYRLERTLCIRVYEAKNISLGSRESSSELCCEIAVEDEVLAKTGVQKKTALPLWNEAFTISNLPEIAQGLTVTLVSKSKHKKEARIGKISLSVSDLHNDRLAGEWYRLQKEHRQGAFATLAGLGAQALEPTGSLRLGTWLEERIILPVYSYEPLIDIMTNFDNHVTIELAQKAPNLESFVSNALNIYEGLGLAIPWIYSLIDYEVSGITADDANTLFRGNSLLTKAIDLYMRMISRNFLEQTIGETIRALIDSKLYIEVDPTKTPKGTNISDNWKQLFLYVRSLWRGIELGKSKCPIQLRSIFSYLQASIVKKFVLDDEEENNRQTIRYNCVSGFIFLRLICPAILSPRTFGLVRDQPDVKTTRSLTLLAKCLMSLANLVDPSLKEPWMSFLHQFIMENTKSLMEFINFVSITPFTEDELYNDKGDYIKTAFAKVTKAFHGDKLPQTTLEDIPIPPHYIDLPKELSRMTSTITSWSAVGMSGDNNLATIHQICCMLDERCKQYRKRPMYACNDDSFNSKACRPSHSDENGAFSYGFSGTDQSVELLEVASLAINSPILDKFNKSVSSVLFQKGTLHLHHVRLATTNGIIKPTVLKNDSVSSKVLREYQQECVNVSLEQLRNGKRRQIVSLPVGSGKTVVMANLLAKIPDRSDIATKTLVLAHREELLDQAQRQISSINPKLKVVVDQGRRKPNIGNADVVVASVPTLGRSGSERLERYDPELFKAILIDEAHHAAARTYQHILDHFGATDHDSDMFVWGCSATVRRHDGIGLQGVFDHIVYHRDFLTMVEEGWLCNMKVTTVQTMIDLSSVGTRFNDFKENELSRAINTDDRNEIIVKSWQKYAENNGRKSTLVFAVDMAHTLSLCNAFRTIGVKAQFITSKSSVIERHEALESFREGSCPVLVNCGILTEGTDIPRIDCILMARPTKSSTLFQQMFGRGMRLHESKKDCLIIDFVDNFHRAGRSGIVTIPTLLGLDISTELKDIDLLEVERQAEQQVSKIDKSSLPLDQHASSEADIDRPTAHLTITEYDSIFEVVDDCSGTKDLHKISHNAWVSVGDNVYILSIKGGSIKLEKDNEDLWHAKLRRIIPTSRSKSIYTKPKDLPLTADSRDQAIKAMDTYLNNYYKADSANSMWIRRNARYRQEPATEAQIKVLKKRFGVAISDGTLTKGQAMNLFARMQEGQGKIWRRQAESRRKKISDHDERVKAGVLRRNSTE